MKKTETNGLRIEFIEPSKLNPYINNPRKNEAVIEPLVKSIEHFGFINPIIARKKDNMIIAGHSRWKSALKMQLKQVPVIFIDMTENDSKLFNIADNRIQDFAEFDNEKLADIFANLKDLDLDIEITGFNEDEIDDFIVKDIELGNIDFKDSEKGRLVITYEKIDEEKIIIKINETLKEFKNVAIFK